MQHAQQGVYHPSHMLAWFRSKYKPEPTDPWSLYKAGRTDEAALAASELLASEPASIDGRLVQALMALDAGQADKARLVLERLAAQAAADPRVHNALGRTLFALGKNGAAQAAFQQAIVLQPDGGEARLNLALVAMAGGQEARAMELLQEAVALEPKLADAQFHFGNLLIGRGRMGEAEEHYRLALASAPQHAHAHSNLGGLLKDRSQMDEAARHFEEALQLEPELSPASFNLAMMRIDQGRWDEAVLLLQQTLKSDPRQADALYWLGNGLMRQGEAAAAREAYQAAVALNSNFERARWGFAMAQLPAVPATQAEQLVAVPDFSREISKIRNWVMAHRPVDAHLAVGAQQPYYLAYIPHNHKAVLGDYGTLCSKLMLGWAMRSGIPLPVVAGGAKLKVGIVSAHIHSHSVWRANVKGWLECLDPEKFELHVFYTNALRDSETEWAASHVSQIHHQLGDWSAWANAIADARCDVLIYPEIGMDTTTLRLAALRLARVQLASWGHPVTTGLPTIDGFVSAAAFEPEDAAGHYTESLATLPGLGCSYKPFGTAPARVDLTGWGIKPTDNVLLCAGTPFKYAPADDAVLLDIARRCAPCKLVFFRARPDQLSQMLEARLRAVFADAGMDFDAHVRFIPWQTQAGFFGMLDRADVCLDSIGFSGFNTTMQAIERATPVVAWEGEFMRGRFASGILREAGLDDWVASTKDDYVEKIARLCSDNTLREQVRSQIMARRGALFDDRKIVGSLAEYLLSRG